MPMNSEGHSRALVLSHSLLEPIDGDAAQCRGEQSSLLGNDGARSL